MSVKKYAKYILFKSDIIFHDMVEYSLTKIIYRHICKFYMSSPCGTTRQHPILKKLVGHLNYVINNFNIVMQSLRVDGINHNYLKNLIFYRMNGTSIVQIYGQKQNINA
jgi:hypothetical protein